MIVITNFERFIMNKKDFHLAYNDLFDNSTFRLMSTNKLANKYYNFVSVGNNDSKAILSLIDPEHMIDSAHINSLSFQEYLNANSILIFEKTTKDDIAKLFSHLNYDYVEKVIQACYAMGSELGFYEKMKKNETFNLGDGFNGRLGKVNAKSIVVLTNIGEIYFQPVLVEQNTDNLRWIVKKSICVYVRFKIINNELHPFVLLTLPYAPRKNITFHLDLHPSFEASSNIYLNVIVNEFEITLSNYLGTLLKRHLKIKAKDLEKLSLVDKKNYLIIAHMNKI